MRARPIIDRCLARIARPDRTCATDVSNRAPHRVRPHPAAGTDTSGIRPRNGATPTGLAHASSPECVRSIVRRFVNRDS